MVFSLTRRYCDGVFIGVEEGPFRYLLDERQARGGRLAPPQDAKEQMSKRNRFCKSKLTLRRLGDRKAMRMLPTSSEILVRFFIVTFTVVTT